jgi:phenylpropionate dioxygenase-like ring-hydroxylating dioxygenase large terminal subunit
VFYTDKDLFEIEVARFLGSHWMLVGHVSQIPEQGDYFVVAAMGASVIVVRGANGAINALQGVGPDSIAHNSILAAGLAEGERRS